MRLLVMLTSSVVIATVIAGCFPPCPDLDGDGYVVCNGLCSPESSMCGECDDSNPYVNPAAVEVCDDGVDNDCNGLVDTEDPECSVVFQPPPVRQKLGFFDGVFNTMVEADCRVCHQDPNITGNTSNVDRHHLRMGTIVPDPTAAPNGTPGDSFECLTCHTLVWNPSTMAYEFAPFRDCLACHVQIEGQASVHHLTATAQGGDCVTCHGSLVNNMGDGHYIPNGDPGPLIPWPSGNPNPGPNGEGSCTFCHDAGTTPDGKIVASNQDTHHGTGFALDGNKCAWCHDVIPPVMNAYSMRTCEGCHGLEALHSIQADSDGDNTIMPGGEQPYYGHVGDITDCFGCHVFLSGMSAASSRSAALYSTAVTPHIAHITPMQATAGSDTPVVVTGSAFTNLVNGLNGPAVLNAEATLEAPDGTITALAPSAVNQSTMVITIPSSLSSGTYVLRALKNSKKSNKAIIAVIPPVVIDTATCNMHGTVTIRGSGFSDYVDATDSGTDVLMIGYGKKRSGDIISWNDTEIVAQFASCGDTIRVKSVFGTAKKNVTEPDRSLNMKQESRRQQRTKRQ